MAHLSDLRHSWAHCAPKMVKALSTASADDAKNSAGVVLAHNTLLCSVVLCHRRDLSVVVSVFSGILVHMTSLICYLCWSVFCAGCIFVCLSSCVIFSVLIRRMLLYSSVVCRCSLSVVLFTFGGILMHVKFIMLFMFVSVMCLGHIDLSQLWCDFNTRHDVAFCCVCCNFSVLVLACN